MPHRWHSSSRRWPRWHCSPCWYTPFYRNSARLAGWMGATIETTDRGAALGVPVVLCIGIQVLWNGAAELLGALPLGSAGAS